MSHATNKKQNLRNTKLYKKLNNYLACAISEGFNEGEEASEKDQLIAWQYILDKGLWKTLQGWYGRNVHRLIEAGLIKPASDDAETLQLKGHS